MKIFKLTHMNACTFYKTIHEFIFSVKPLGSQQLKEIFLRLNGGGDTI